MPIPCSTQGCPSRRYCDGLCRKHYTALPCVEEECSNRRSCGTRGKCHKHYRKMKRLEQDINAPPTPAERKRTWTRLLSKMERDGDCWLWTGTKVTGGYGEILFRYRQCRTHRLAWFLTYGYWIELPLVTSHKCHQPLCFNPSHLESATQDQNVAENVTNPTCEGRLGYIRDDDALEAAILAECEETDDGCFLPSRSRFRFSRWKKETNAHRFLYERKHGPADGGVRRVCGDVSCLNVDHMRLTGNRWH